MGLEGNGETEAVSSLSSFDDEKRQATRVVQMNTTKHIDQEPCHCLALEFFLFLAFGWGQSLLFLDSSSNCSNDETKRRHVRK